jgi:hypothetical protein
MECYSVIKRNEELIPSTTWMDLGTIMLNERRQSQITTYFHLYEKAIHQRQKVV